MKFKCLENFALYINHNYIGILYTRQLSGELFFCLYTTVAGNRKLPGVWWPIIIKRQLLYNCAYSIVHCAHAV